MGTKRKVNPEDKQRFFAAIAAGSSITEASRISGVHINTGSRWLAQSKAAKAKLDAAVLAVTKTKSREGGAQYRAYEQDLDESNNLLPAIPHNRLCDEALRGLHDFDFFRKHSTRNVRQVANYFGIFKKKKEKSQNNGDVDYK